MLRSKRGRCLTGPGRWKLMAALDHWHPVLPSTQLRQAPVGIRLAGTNIVLFRGAAGQLGALADVCPHRRMRLSLGKVVNHRLQCLYHGWTYNCAGAGESPATPKLFANANAFETTEKHGFIWLKSCDSNPVFPPSDVDGWYNVCNPTHRAPAPLELAVDTFCRI